MRTLGQATGLEITPEWRYPTSEGLTWRAAMRADLPRLLELWDEMDERMGEKQDRPDLFSLPTLLPLVAEDETGRIVGAMYSEIVADWTMIGTSRRVARAVDPLWPSLHCYLFDRHIRVTRMLVPMRLRKHMGRLMPKMRDLTEAFAHFAYTVRL